MKKRGPEGWNDRWNVTDSKSNTIKHNFHRQYFDKEAGMRGY